MMTLITIRRVLDFYETPSITVVHAVEWIEWARTTLHQDAPCRLNPSISVGKAIDIMARSVAIHTGTLPPLIAKNVLRVCLQRKTIDREMFEALPKEGR